MDRIIFDRTSTASSGRKKFNYETPAFARIYGGASAKFAKGDIGGLAAKDLENPPLGRSKDRKKENGLLAANIRSLRSLRFLLIEGPPAFAANNPLRSGRDGRLQAEGSLPAVETAILAVLRRCGPVGRSRRRPPRLTFCSYLASFACFVVTALPHPSLMILSSMILSFSSAQKADGADEQNHFWQNH